MDKIKKYLSPNLNDKEKSDIGLTILKSLTLYTQQNGTTPEDYISSFSESDVNFILVCIRKAIGDNFKYSYNPNNNVDTQPMKAILSSMASYCILKELKEDYFRNKTSLLDTKMNIAVFPDMDLSFRVLALENNNSMTEDICKFFNGLYAYTESENQVEVIMKGEVLDLGNKDNIVKVIDDFNRLLVFAGVLRKEIQNNIKQAIDKIKQRLRLIYSGLYRSNAAIIFKEGNSLILESVNGNDIKNGRGIDKYISSVLDTWYQVRGIRETNIDFGNTKNIEDQNDFTDLLNNLVEKSNVYIPYFHLFNLRKGKEWFDEYFKSNGMFDTYLIPYLTSLDSNNFSKVIDALLQGFTQFMALTSVNGHTFLVRGSYFLTEPLDAVSISQRGNKMWTDTESPFYIAFQKNSVKYVAGSLNNVTTLATLLQEGQKDYRDIVTITYIYNKKMYEKENLFAYKLYSGPNAIVPSVLEPVIGVKMDGSLYRKNIFSSNFTNIIAGSRSGKGTLTMSLLAPLLMEGKPIVYLDNKADIASLFWNLEEQISNTWGKDKVKFLAIDAKTQEATGEKGRVGRVAYSPRHVNDDNLLNVPTIFDEPDKRDWLKLLRNLKIIQLFLLLGYIEPVKGDLLKDDTYIFVDEITDYFNRLNNGLYRELNVNQDEFDNVELHNYLDRISIMIDSIKSDFGVLFSTMKGKRWAKFKFVSIGQSLNLKEWNTGLANNTNGKKKYTKDIGSAAASPFGYALQTEDNVTWLSGKGQALLDDYSVTPAEREFLRDGKDGVPGSFIVHTQKPKIKGETYSISKCPGLFLLGANKSITDYTFIRTYFALVNNDITKEDIEIIMEKMDISEKELGAYLDSQKFVKYTYMFLNNVYLGAEKDGMVAECMTTALNDIYDFENDTPRAEVGFDGLLNLLLQKKGINLFNTSDANVETLFEKWNKIYEVLHMIVSSVFPGKYTTLEEYLFDVSGESICSTPELLEKYERTNTKKQQKQRIINQRVQAIQENLDGLNDEEKERRIAEETKKAEAEVDKTFEEEEAAKKAALELEARQKLKENFRKEFNAVKGKVGIEITKLLASLKKEKDEEIFDRNQEIYCSQDYKDTKFKSQFLVALELVKENPDLYAECEREVDDYITGQYASIVALTFSDTDEGKSNREKEEKEKAKQVGGTQEGSMGGAQIPQHVPEVKKGSQPHSTFKGQRMTPTLDTGDLGFDVSEYEDDSWQKSGNNVRVEMELVKIITNDIKRRFGGVQQIQEITVTGSGSLVINGIGYAPQLNDKLVQSMPDAKQMYYQEGRLADIVNIGAIVDNIMDNVFTFGVESPAIAKSTVFQNEIGIKNYNYSKLFRRMSNLQTIHLPDGEINRNNPQDVSNSGIGLGEKLAGLFGFGKGKKDSPSYVPNPAPTNNRDSMTDRIFDSKPVRVLTGALGWTLGCKAVVMAATIFGPWGLLFGAFAAAGAYKEIKKGNTQKDKQSQSQRRQSRSNGQSYNQNGKKQNRQNNQGGFNQQYSGRPNRSQNQDYDDYDY